MRNENTLIKQIKNKDETALSVLYDNYSAALYGVIVRICKDEQQAQNLLQDTFLTIWEKAYQYNPQKGKFYTWAYRIAKNKTLNSLRQSSNLIQIEDLSVYTNKEDIISNEPEYLKLSGSLKKLEAHHQKAIELVYFQGLTHREAHEEMNVPLGTFKSYIKQALKKLQLNFSKVVVWLLILFEVTK